MRKERTQGKEKETRNRTQRGESGKIEMSGRKESGAK